MAVFKNFHLKTWANPHSKMISNVFFLVLKAVYTISNLQKYLFNLK